MKKEDMYDIGSPEYNKLNPTNKKLARILQYKHKPWTMKTEEQFKEYGDSIYERIKELIDDGVLVRFLCTFVGLTKKQFKRVIVSNAQLFQLISVQEQREEQEALEDLKSMAMNPKINIMAVRMYLTTMYKITDKLDADENGEDKVQTPEIIYRLHEGTNGSSKKKAKLTK